MKIFVTGATGFVGSAACLRLRRDGHEVVAWARDPDAARGRLGAEVEVLDTAASDQALAAMLSQCDAVLNLAGAPVATRWTAARRKAIENSRVDLTQRLVRAMANADRAPPVLVSASAIGLYGDRGNERLDAYSAHGTGFLADVCAAWEGAAQGARDHGARVVSIRIGVVFGREGGAMASMRPAFALGLGARLGSGQQWMSWIHLDDLLELLVLALTHDAMQGAYEGVAPEPIRNATFTNELAASLGRKARLVVPGAILRMVFGGAAEVMLASQRVVPTRTLASGFVFRFPTLGQALSNLAAGTGIAFDDVTSGPASPYLNDRPVRHRLEQVTELDRPIDEVFSFFERPENLGPLTPPTLSFDIVTPGPVPMHVGSTIDYRIALSGFPMRWRTRIETYEPRRRFVDAQLRGPYSSWHHEHRFESMPGGGTRIVDIVHYAVPLGLLGRVAHRLFVRSQLERIFEFRARAIQWRFGRTAAPRATAAA